MTASPEDADRLQRIAADQYGGRIDRDEARSRICDIVLERLQCARVSLWRFAFDDATLVLQCTGAKRAGGPFEKDPTRLDIGEYRDYFAVLAEHGVFVSEDAMAEPALKPMYEKYTEAYHVLSMLDAAYLLNGRAYGVVCCEETEAPRAWRAADVQALRAIVARLALLAASHDDRTLSTGASMPLNPGEPPASDRRR